MENYTYKTNRDETFNPFDGTDDKNWIYPKDIFTGFIAAQALDIRTLAHPGAYLLHHLRSDCVYIGSTKNVRDRYNRHLSDLRANKHASKRLQELYDADSWVVIYFKPCKDRDQAFAEEQSLLDKYMGKPYVVNRAPTATSQKGFKHSEETKQKMAVKRNTPELRALISKLHKGRVLTEEHRSKIARAGLGRPVSEKNKAITSALFKGKKRTPEVTANIRKAILAKTAPVFINGVEYGSANSAAKILGMSSSTVEYRINSPSIEFKDWYRVKKH